MSTVDPFRGTGPRRLLLGSPRWTVPSKHHGLLHGMRASLGATTPRGIIIVCSDRGGGGSPPHKVPEKERNCLLPGSAHMEGTANTVSHTLAAVRPFPSTHTPTSTCPVCHDGTATGASNLERLGVDVRSTTFHSETLVGCRPFQFLT